MKKDSIHKPVEITRDPSGILVMTFNGNLLAEDILAFKLSLEVCSIVIKHQFDETKQKVKTLLDMTHFSGKYTAEAMQVLADFAKANTPYIDKTASYGGTHAIQMAGETVTSLAGRDNIKVFDSKEEAISWLNEITT